MVARSKKNSRSQKVKLTTLIESKVAILYSNSVEYAFLKTTSLHDYFCRDVYRWWNFVLLAFLASANQ